MSWASGRDKASGRPDAPVGEAGIGADMQGEAGPHGGIATFGAFFTSGPRVGTLLSPLCLRRGVPMYSLRPTRFRLHPNFKIPPCAPAIRRRHYQPTEPAMKKQRITPRAQHQVGGPPQGLEKTGRSLFGLHSHVGGTLGCRGSVTAGGCVILANRA